MPDRFAIHTECEPDPWWMVDLELSYPIGEIRVHNRRDGLAERARSLTVEVSIDRVTWTTIHAGLLFFGSGAECLSLPLAGRILARYVRLSLKGTEFLHLAKVEVFVSGEVERLFRFWKENGLSAGRLMSGGKTDLATFNFSTDAPDEAEGEIDSLSILGFGRSGNSIIQIINALKLALSAGIATIYLPESSILDLAGPRELGGIAFLPLASRPPPGQRGATLKGGFFYGAPMESIRRVAPDRSSRHIVDTYLKPLFKRIPDEAPAPPNEAAIHIRGGDVFTAEPPPHAGYVQPPLSYYVKCIDELVATRGVERFRIVHEDASNPCLSGIHDYLSARGIPWRDQSASLMADIGALSRARFAIFGFGTFGLAALALSDVIERVYAFRSDSFGKYLDYIPEVCVLDDSGDYIRPGDWTASPAQLELMVGYPGEKLAVRTLLAA